jgi:hypothetical protein
MQIDMRGSAITFLMIIVAGVLVLVFGVVSTQDAFKSFPLFSLTNQPSPAPSANTTLTATPGQSDQKKTQYRHTNGTYEFSYPIDWEHVPVSEGCGPVFYFPNTKKVWMTVCGPHTNPQDTPEQLARQAVAAGEQLVSRETIHVDGHVAVRQERTSGAEHREINVFIGNVLEAQPGTLAVYFYMQDPALVPEAKQQFEEILSTFTVRE